MNKPVMHIDEAPCTDLAELLRLRGWQMPADRYGGRTAPPGRLFGARQLGDNVTVIAPAKA